MVIEFGEVLTHEPSSFLASNLIAHVEIDPFKSSTSTSDANYVVSSDISDKRYLCDTPLSNASGCGCAISSKGLVGDAGKSFPGSTLGGPGSQTAVIGPLGIQGPVSGVPHPSFRFAQKVSDVSVNVVDVTGPGEPKLMWDAKFRLAGPDGSPGSDYLPSSHAPIGGSHPNFHKMCSALNSWRTYKLTVDAGGEAPIQQSIVMKAYIVHPDKLIDPLKAGQSEGGGSIDDGTSIKVTGPRLFAQDSEPKTDAVAAVKKSSFATSFACRENLIGFPDRNTYAADSTFSIRPESRTFPSVTASYFTSRDHDSTSFPGAEESCCNCAPELKNPPNCHKLPTVTIHMPQSFANFF